MNTDEGKKGSGESDRHKQLGRNIREGRVVSMPNVLKFLSALFWGSHE